MRVLMYMAPASLAVPGGHRRQMEQTAAHLRRLGVNVEQTQTVAQIDAAYDLVHSFGIGEEVVQATREHQLPLIVSPIYWSIDFALNQGRMHGGAKAMLAQLSERARLAAASLTGGRVAVGRHAGLFVEHAKQALLLRMANLLLPNSQAERDDLIRECGTEECRLQVVPNAVDAACAATGPEMFQSVFGLSDFVLCVGRVEPRKNQLRVIRATRELDLPLVLVDPIHPDHRRYRGQCLRELGKRGLYLERLPDELLNSAYAAARVHVLASFFETTGLASLEAGLAGCNVVVADQLHTREYFRDWAWYCEPSSTSSIRQAIGAAWDAPRGQQLREHILSHYTWEHTANSTLEAYERVLSAGEERLSLSSF